MITIEANSRAWHHFENADQIASWMSARTEREEKFYAIATLPGHSVQFWYGEPTLGQTTVKHVTESTVDKQTCDAVEDALAAFLALL